MSAPCPVSRSEEARVRYDLEIEAGGFDAITILDVIEHLRDPFGSGMGVSLSARAEQR